MEPYSLLISKIIKEQASIIGPIALEQAQKVDGMEVINTDDIKITGNAKEVIDHLVNQYAKLFGRASIEVCKEAVHEIKPQIALDNLPDILK